MNHSDGIARDDTPDTCYAGTHWQKETFEPPSRVWYIDPGENQLQPRLKSKNKVLWWWVFMGATKVENFKIRHWGLKTLFPEINLSSQ